MRSLMMYVLIGTTAGSAVMAQDALTYSFNGRVGLGYLSEETARPLSAGYQYVGPVAKVELTGRAEILAMEDLRFGALGRISYLRGNQSNFDLTLGGSTTGGSGSEFGGSEIDLAVYAALPSVTLSYGNMETAFDLATREIEQGSSLVDGGNAVWMNIGDAAGSTGVRTYPFEGPAVGLDFRTLRLDLQFGEVTFSASRSKAETTAGRVVEVDALGAIWRRELENTVLFVAAGYDEGQDDRFRSFSFGLTSGGFNVVLNRINRAPLVINSGITGAYDTTFKGLSLSYDFRDLTLGFGHSSQTPGPLGDRVFEGTAQAVFASWQARENVSVDFEYSQSDYRISSGFDTRKASVAVALEF
ncbi:hypothetical protein [Tabrizicola sp.]|uniref:hypothetical protein n=1 Tax=Tabrizicola sp. TaxID=2005166 RepID=UPI0025D86025|nr:hypothetical protein [Tabrizicola sp.]